jgi:hypothetical protein
MKSNVASQGNVAIKVFSEKPKQMKAKRRHVESSASVRLLG